MMTDEKHFELLIGQRKAIVKANQTIISLCKYITKITDDEKALKKANAEIKKAQRAIEREETTDKLMGKIIELNCKTIATDESLTEEEKQYHINGFQGAHKQFAITQK